MKLLLDEMLSPQIARSLRERGHDVVAVKELAEAVGLPDEAILALARRDDRAVVTNNVRDFRRLGAEAAAPGGGGHSGLVFLSARFRRTRADAGRLADQLAQILETEEQRGGIAGREVWLS